MSQVTWLTIRAPSGHAGRVEGAPVGAGHGGGADQGEVAGHDVDAAVGQPRPGPPRASGRSGPSGRTGRGPRQKISSAGPMRRASRAAISASRPERPQRVDVADVRVAAGHEPAGEAVAGPEGQVQDAGRGEARPAGATSAGRSRRERARASGGPTRPGPRPVTVMRLQNRSRGPLNVAANAATAPASPTSRGSGPDRVRPARSRPGASASRWTADSSRPTTRSDAEGQVQPRGLEVDHRDRPLLAGRAQLGRADHLRQERQGHDRQQASGRQPADRDGQPRAM